MVSTVRIPHLDKEAIQNYMGFSAFHKGERYVINQAIRQGKLKNHVLTALCQGHEFDPYRVEVIFHATGIEQSYCSCPVGAGGKCKHVAALLLTWLETPEVFVEWDNLKANLQSYDVLTLLELIDLLDDQFESSTEIIRAFGRHLQATKSPQLARYARRIDEAFHLVEFPWYHPAEGRLTGIAFSLDKIRSDADQLLAEGQIEEAIRIIQSLIQQIINHLDDYLDSWGNLSEELNRCVSSLNEALQRVESQRADLRLRIFRILFRLIEEQLYRNTPIGAEEAKKVILQHVSPLERDKIVAWVEAIQTHHLSAEDRVYLGLEDFLIDLQKDILEPEFYLAHYRETGQIFKLIESLLALGRVQEAQQAARKEELISQVIPLANIFIKYQQDAIAEKLVMNFSKDPPDLQALRWLKDFYQQRGQFEEALRAAKQILYLAPQFSSYQAVQEIAQKGNQWPAIRQEIIQHFTELQEEWLLVEIYLDERDMERAIEAFEKISHLSHFSLKNTHDHLLALRLAAAARPKYAHFALKIYQEVVDNLIEERHRESYQRACDHLKTIRSIFEDLQQSEEWKAYLYSLLQTYRRLSALKNEIYQANLL